MRTGCPVCSTVFRITPEQLRARGGKVRCGQCHSIFNALESLLEEAPPPLAAVPPSRGSVAPEPPPASAPEPVPAAEAIPDHTPPEPVVEGTAVEPPAEALREPTTEIVGDEERPDASELPPPDLAIAEESTDDPATESIEVTPSEEASIVEPTEESPAETTLAAREAGLVAARELSEMPGYNRWAAGTLAGGSLGGLDAEMPRKPVWPFVLVGLLSLLALLAQLAYHFRTEVVQRLPITLVAYDTLDVSVPLPQIADLVSIEASDLQADSGRGLLVLSATLKNRAPHPQSWPALELTLTDARDAVVARRILLAADYLPPQADPAVFAASSETAVRMWIDAKEVGAAGYRLYVFYP